MDLIYNSKTSHYRPMLIAMWGNHPDPYYDISKKWYEKCIHTPIGVAMFAGEGIHDAFNESIQYCMDHKIPFMILVHQSIAPRADWSEIFRGVDMKKHAFIYKDNRASFIVINVKKVRKFDYYRTIGSAKDLHKWMIAKAVSEGINVRVLNETELNYIGVANEEPEPAKRPTGNARKGYTRDKRDKKTPGSKKRKRS